jgi:metal-responsive CopG/Arc/MetJ family transcriptional regulator
MAKTKIAVTIDSGLLNRLDRLVSRNRYPNRSRAIEQAVAEALDRVDRTRLAEECAKLDPREERSLAEEGLDSDVETWPRY